MSFYLAKQKTYSIIHEIIQIRMSVCFPLRLFTFSTWFKVPYLMKDRMFWKCEQLKLRTSLICIHKKSKVSSWIMPPESCRLLLVSWFPWCIYSGQGVCLSQGNSVLASERAWSTVSNYSYYYCKEQVSNNETHFGWQQQW